MNIDVILVAQDAGSDMVSGKSAVVIDVLRATSTMSTALANGCSAIYAVTSPERAFALARTFAPGSFLIGGERGGLRVEGFDLGNSPREYTRQVVDGKKIIMTTTNGTLAISNCACAAQVFICSLLNAQSVAERVAQEVNDVVIVCSGTEGVFTLEDAYCAGLVAEIVFRINPSAHMSDMANACRIIYRAYSASPVELMDLAEHGQKLRRIGFGEDIEYCSRLNMLKVVPVLKGDVITLEGR